MNRVKAEMICRVHPEKAIGYCYQDSNPDYCWVKAPGTPYVKCVGWTAVCFIDESKKSVT